MKNMKCIIKLIMLFLSFNLMIILSSCMHKTTLISVHENDTHDITQNIASEIKRAYFESEHSISSSVNHIWISHYLGTYSGCEIVFLNEGTTLDSSRAYNTATRHVKLADYELVFPSSQLLFVYKDAKIYTLTEAHENKLITAEDIYKIGIKLNVVYVEQIYQIVLETEELYNDLKNLGSDVHEGEFVIFEDLGIYNECKLICVEDAFFANDIELKFQIEEYEIIMPKNRILVAYESGNFYTLTEAYENGFITEEDTYEIGTKVDSTFKERYPAPITE